MTRTIQLLGALALGVALTACSDPSMDLPTTADRPEAVTPSPRTVAYEWMSIERWQTMHAEDVAIAEQNQVDLLFVGDSITEGWPPELMENYFGQYNPANFGIGGDKTENLLWRLNNGAVGELNPQAVSVLIGVNNFGLSQHEPDDVALGVQAVVDTLLDAFPNAKILVHGVFPYKESPEDPAREQVHRLNTQIAHLAAHDRVFYLNIGDQLVQENGHISTDIMPDYLHLSEAGYRIWADNLQPIFADWLGE